MANSIEHRETADLTHRWMGKVLDALEGHEDLIKEQADKLAVQAEMIQRLEAKNLQMARELENKNGQAIALCRKCRRRI